MAKYNKSDLLKYFQRGSVPTSTQIGELIDSNINIEDTGSQHIKSILCMSSGSNGEFNSIAPSFVPNLHPYIKVFSLTPHTALHNSKFAAPGDLTKTTLNLWESTGSFAHNNEDNKFTAGAFTLKTGAFLGAEAAIQTTITPFKCETGKPWWVKTCFKLDDADQVEFFFGLCEEEVTSQNNIINGTAAAGKDKIGFNKTQDSSSPIRVKVSKNGNALPNTTISTYSNNNLVKKLAMYWDGVESVKFYAAEQPDSDQVNAMDSMDLVQTVSISTDTHIPNDSNLRLAFVVESGEAGIQTATIEYIHGAVFTTI